MGSIWAVATNTFKQALRMKVAIVFTILLLILLPVMGTIMTGDGTLRGRLQTFISYGLSLTSLLLSLLTIFVAAYSLTSDIKEKQIYTVVSKPIRRFQIILGKLLGVLVLDLILLIIFAGLIYGIAVSIPHFIDAPVDQVTAANTEFYTARKSLKPEIPDVTEEARKEYRKLERSGQLPENLSRQQVLSWITEIKQLEKRAVSVNQEITWDFRNVEPLDPNQSIYLRYKYDVAVNPPDLKVSGQWVVGDYQQINFGLKPQSHIYSAQRHETIRTFHELEVPANAITPEGFLGVKFRNLPLNRTVVIFPLKDGFELLYEAGTFTGNFIRCSILIYFRLIFLACLGLLTASFLSFPVAILFCLMIFFTGTISEFISDSFQYVGPAYGAVYTYAIKPLLHTIPRFDKYNPTDYLVPGRIFTWLTLAKAAAFMVGIKSVIILLLSLVIFAYREIAKIVV